MSIGKKVKWIAGLLLLFLLFLATNLNDRKNYRTLNNSVATIYADRLIATDIIFDLSRLIQEKEITYIRWEDGKALGGKPVSESTFNSLLDIFSETTLTKEESQLFAQLQEKIARLFELERRLAAGSVTPSVILQKIGNIKDQLGALSDIQMEEGRNEYFISKRAGATVDLFTYIEIALLALIALLGLSILLKDEQGATEGHRDEDYG